MVSFRNHDAKSFEGNARSFTTVDGVTGHRMSSIAEHKVIGKVEIIKTKR